MSELSERLKRVQAQMHEQDVEYLLLGPSSDLLYLTGFETKLSARLTMLVVAREGTPRLVLPDFELPGLASLPTPPEAVTWTDGSDAAALTVSLLSRAGRGAKAAVGGQLQTRFLLALMNAGLRAELVQGDVVMEPVRICKTPSELAALRRASAAADAVIDELAELPLEGMTERGLVTEIRRLVSEHGNDPAGTGLAAFGENSAAPHHHSGDRTARRGDAVIADYGGTSSHYRADITRMLHLGPADDEFRRVYAIADKANQAAFERVGPGVMASEIDAAARDHIAKAGYGEQFLHRTGHGIGLDIHEAPYLVAGNPVELRPGMAFTIEPGIYLEGRFGVRVEDVIIVTEDGAERLNKSTHRVRVLG
jgi:Xaa-Pro aminopeptidase